MRSASPFGNAFEIDIGNRTRNVGRHLPQGKAAAAEIGTAAFHGVEHFIGDRVVGDGQSRPPSISQASETAKPGMPLMKLVVPSIGSMHHSPRCPLPSRHAVPRRHLFAG